MTGQISKANNANTGGLTNQIKTNGGHAKDKSNQIPAQTNQIIKKNEPGQIKSNRGRPFGCSPSSGGEDEPRAADRW
jgi:hypothetical protein